MSKEKFTIPYVQAKETAIENDVPQDIKKLQIEFAENAKALAANPSRQDASILNTRQAAINTALKTLHATE